MASSTMQDFSAANTPLPRRRLVVGNWKMNVPDGGGAALARRIAQAGPYGCTAAVCVPHPFIGEVERALKGTDICLGAQDCSDQPAGAFTGEVSAQMLALLRCQFVILGHSERRLRHQETDVVVAAKARTALAHDITPIICVGETADEHRQGEAILSVSRQIMAVSNRLGRELAHCVIAYEPVWAIGSGKSASPEQAQEMHRVIRQLLVGPVSQSAALVPILYGGSVKPETARELFAQPDIDGALVGGASLDADQFASICACTPGPA